MAHILSLIGGIGGVTTHPLSGVGLSKSTPLRPGRDFTSYVTRYGCACVRIAVTRDGCACEKGFGFSVYGLVITVLMIFLMEKWSFISIIFVQ